MKRIIIIILGIILGIFVDYKFVKHYYNKEEITDSIKHDTVNIIIKDTVIPNEIIKSIEDVNIDTINTIINGKVIESNYKITILK